VQSFLRTIEIYFIWHVDLDLHNKPTIKRYVQCAQGKKNGNGRSEIIDNSIVILIGLKPANATRVQLSKSWVNKAEMNFPIADSRFPPCLSWFLVLCLGAISSPCHPLLFSRWFKEENEQLLPLQLSERITIVSAGLLKITKVRRLH